jgi:glycosyltransferase involved in cell wall biosynthesis
MGVDLENRFTPSTEPVTDPVLVFAGRLVEKKGVARLIEAMPQVLAEEPRARLIIAGHGPLAEELAASVVRLNLDKAVEFVGKVPNARLPDILRRARLAVLPFRAAEDGDIEGLGLVTIEALGCGLPVIVGDVPAVHDVIEHGLNGWIVPAGPPATLAEAILRLLRQPDLAASLAAAGRRQALERFDWTVTAARYRDLLETLVR